MTHTTEFDDQAAAIAAQIPQLPLDQRIAAACRGSGNPMALAWLADSLAVQHDATVIDLGAGLGGPAAWLKAHYRCRAVNVEVAAAAAIAGFELFGIPTIRATGERVPVRDDAFDVALLLGVLSVVDRPDPVLREARRVTRRLGVLEYCTADDAPRSIGGSRFTSPAALAKLVGYNGWHVMDYAPITVDPPRRWVDASDQIDVKAPRSEAAVVDAVECGVLCPWVIQAER